MDKKDFSELDLKELKKILYQVFLESIYDNSYYVSPEMAARGIKKVFESLRESEKQRKIANEL